MNTSDLLTHLMEIKAGQARLTTEVIALKKAVEGNGQPGLTQRVEVLEGAKNRLWGMGAMLTFLWGTLEVIFHWKKH